MVWSETRCTRTNWWGGPKIDSSGGRQIAERLFGVRTQIGHASNTNTWLNTTATLDASPCRLTERANRPEIGGLYGALTIGTRIIGWITVKIRRKRNFPVPAAILNIGNTTTTLGSAGFNATLKNTIPPEISRLRYYLGAPLSTTKKFINNQIQKYPSIKFYPPMP